MKNDLRLIAGMSPYAAVNYIRKGIGYDEYLSEYAQNHGIELKELTDIADEIMESAVNCKTYDDWKRYIDIYTANLKESTMAGAKDRDGVALTTFHGAKGLEYDTVYIIDANEGITPYKKAIFESETEEERRMFYVAMTRAREHLNIFYSRERYNKKLEASRFVKEIM
ncbi:MAG: 3'-5' exonuclease, partial [Butyrivibrio sp.]